MQRPILDPTFNDPAPAKAKAPKKRRFAWVGKVLLKFFHLLILDPLGKRRQLRIEDGTRLQRFFHGLTYRLALVPMLLVLFLVALVLAATHPGRTNVGADPLAFGVHYDPVSFLSEDNVKLEAWLVPAFDAKDVIREGEKALQKRWPAVVLVHDFAGSRQQLLPLVKPLHERGFVVLLLALRGGQSLTGDAQTFGLKESMDVNAAVEMLRRRAFVDSGKIAVLGVGTGANASLLAAKKDPQLAALVLSNPVDGFDSAFARRVGENRTWLPPLRTMFRWTFQVMYSVDAEDLNMSNFKELIAARAVLIMPPQRELLDPSAIRDVEQFLSARMGIADRVAHAK